MAINAALDRTVLIEGFRAGSTHRATSAVDTPGGKAIHAATVARSLGADTVVVTALGGKRGAEVRALLERHGHRVVCIPVDGETRGTYTVVDARAGAVVEVSEPAPAFSPDEHEEFAAAVVRASVGAGLVLACGSLPRGVPAGFYEGVISAARRAGALVLVDASGGPLAACLAAQPDLVKPNLLEAGELLGHHIDQDAPIAHLADVARRLLARGPRSVWLTLGPRGSILANDSECGHLTVAARKEVNAVGCGDAMMGAMAFGLIQRLSLQEAAAFGVAAASSKLGQLAPDHVDPQETWELVGAVTYRRLS